MEAEQVEKLGKALGENPRRPEEKSTHKIYGMQREEADEYFSAEEDEVQCRENGGARRKEGGLELLNDCKRLFQDDKLFQALRAERALAEVDPALHAKHSAYLAMIRSAGEEVKEACKGMEGDEGWTLIHKPSHPGDCQIWYRPEANSAIHSLRVSADMEASLEYLLVLLNEVELYSRWLPFIGGSKTLLRTARCALYAWVKVNSPAALLINHRDTCIHVKAIDALDEEGRVLLIVRNHDAGLAALSSDFNNDYHGMLSAGGEEDSCPKVECPEGGVRTVRMEIKHAALSLYPLANGGTRVVAVGLVDPKLDVMPAWLINMIAHKVCWVGMWQWNRHARQVSLALKACY
jgi:hypothetical protein